MQQANIRTLKAGQEINHAACRQMDRKGKQEMDHSACRQMDRGRAADGSYSMPADEQGQGSAGMDRKRTGQVMEQAAGRQIEAEAGR